MKMTLDIAGKSVALDLVGGTYRVDGTEAKPIETDAREFICLIKDFEEDSSRVAGWGNFKSVDRYGDLVLPAAFVKRMPTFKEHPVMLLGHESDASRELPLGSWDVAEVREKGLYLEGDLLKEHPKYSAVRAGLAKGLYMLSIGFWPTKTRAPNDEEKSIYGEELRRVIEELELVEVSLVTIGANRNAMAWLKRLALDSARVDAEMNDWSAFRKDLALAVGNKAGRPRGAKGMKDMLEAFKVGLADFVDVAQRLATAVEAYEGDEEGEGNEPPPEDGMGEDDMKAIVEGIRKGLGPLIPGRDTGGVNR